ncbi:hypothetical protein Ade02nite_69570 [Paractinoplanes deccanensis]|uniref:Uncharacterized protein n=1 Tax=Paractinoplanes deccanensis TaxID=113561 RepID=A0ABQ3YE79_9ACTN|nr:hypothetical protein [Actinoplanes deccanensis]GID78316.1 hypothetical protein Ade02nite_69570 [Actinoplanes deccanensis]
MAVETIRLISRRTVSVGVHEDDDVPVAKTKERFPAAAVGREFIPPLKPGEEPAKVLKRIEKLAERWGKGGAYVSFKPSPHEVAAGKWTGVHREIGEWLAEHPQVGVIVHHEPEGGKDRLDGPTFEAVFERARKEIKAGWPGARVAYCAMAYQWRPNGVAGKNPGPWKRVEADEYLCDVYSGKNEHNGAFPTNLILPEHPGYVRWFDEIVRPRLKAGQNVTYGLGERGLMGPDKLRAATIRRESDWLDTVFDRYEASNSLLDLPPRVYLAWNSIGWEKEYAWLLTKDSLVAMRELTTNFAKRLV